MDTDFVVTQCCRCKKIRVNANWMQKPSFLSKGVRFSHTYCPVCLESAMDEVSSLSKSVGGKDTAAVVLVS